VTGVITGSPCQWGTGPSGWGWDARLTRSLCKKNYFCEIEAKTGCSLAESSKKGCNSKDCDADDDGDDDDITMLSVCL
jgi:hypothetical protein